MGLRDSIDVRDISKGSGSLKRKSKESSQDKGGAILITQNFPEEILEEGEKEPEVSPYKVKKPQLIGTKTNLRENIKPNWHNNEKL